MSLVTWFNFQPWHVLDDTVLIIIRALKFISNRKIKNRPSLKEKGSKPNNWWPYVHFHKDFFYNIQLTHTSTELSFSDTVQAFLDLCPWHNFTGIIPSQSFFRKGSEEAFSCGFFLFKFLPKILSSSSYKDTINGKSIICKRLSIKPLHNMFPQKVRVGDSKKNFLLLLFYQTTCSQIINPELYCNS